MGRWSVSAAIAGLTRTTDVSRTSATADDFKRWTLTASAAVPHNGSKLEKSGDGMRCHTSADQWSYALIFELPQEARSSNRRLLVSIKGEVEAGSIGLGVVKEDLSSYLV